MTEAQVVTNFVNSETETMIDDTAEAVSNSQQCEPRLVLKKEQRHDLHQDQCRTVPLEGGIVAEELFDF